jgi:putative DNA primase/helicase
MQQLWAEVLELYRARESWFLTADEMLELNASNEGHSTINPMEELLRSRYDWSTVSAMSRKLTASEIAIELGITQPKQSDAKLVANAMRNILRSEPTRTKGRLVWSIPFLIAQ